MINEEYQVGIDRYVLNRMTDEERKAFEQEMEQNAKLKEQAEFTMLVKQVLSDREEFRAMLDKWKQEKMDEESCLVYAEPDDSFFGGGDFSMPHFERSPRIPLKPILWGIAAVVLLAIIVPSVKLLMPKPDAKMEMAKSDMEPLGGTIGEQIRAGHYELALAIIEKEEESLRPRQGKERGFFPEDDELMKQRAPRASNGPKTPKAPNEPKAGNSPSFKGRKPEALRPPMEETEPELQYAQASREERLIELKWLKVHALLGLGKTEEALALLEEIRKAPGEYRMKADSLYNVIKIKTD